MEAHSFEHLLSIKATRNPILQPDKLGKRREALRSHPFPGSPGDKARKGHFSVGKTPVNAKNGLHEEDKRRSGRIKLWRRWERTKLWGQIRHSDNARNVKQGETLRPHALSSRSVIFEDTGYGTAELRNAHEGWDCGLFGCCTSTSASGDFAH
jgi:hypothetical protein